ncbi:MAG: class I SAM-dependent methyltransferase [Actinomycetota bacterium]|nr:class I SAM-dependent methyltransferase [Actinomycetota bacterium]
MSGFQLTGSAASRYERFVAPLMLPFIHAVVQSTVRRGDRVLDVACGTGFATRAAAIAVGPEGTIAAVDVNGTMLDETRQHGPDGVDWQKASALQLPFPDAAFDSLICQKGAQFLPDPLAGLAEMHRVLKPGGRAGVTVWAPIDRSPYLEAQFRVLGGTRGPASPIDVSCPPAGESGLLDWASRAGWSDPEVAAIERAIHLPDIESHIPTTSLLLTATMLP